MLGLLQAEAVLRQCDSDTVAEDKLLLFLVEDVTARPLKAKSRKAKSRKADDDVPCEETRLLP
jgi:hypothetical protein